MKPPKLKLPIICSPNPITEVFLSALPANIKGFRAYFQLKGDVVQQARAFCLDFGDGESTGIHSIESNGKVADDAIYTLDGRRVSQPTQKGIYIQNGKKFIIK